MRPPQIITVAEFSEDMVVTLNQYFAQYAGDDGVVKVEVTTHGLYLKNPYGGRQFLGLARFVAGMHDRR